MFQGEFKGIVYKGNLSYTKVGLLLSGHLRRFPDVKDMYLS